MPSNKYYNTCYIFENENDYFMVDAGGVMQF